MSQCPWAPEGELCGPCADGLRGCNYPRPDLTPVIAQLMHERDTYLTMLASLALEDEENYE